MLYDVTLLNLSHLVCSYSSTIKDLTLHEHEVRSIMARAAHLLWEPLSAGAGRRPRTGEARLRNPRLPGVVRIIGPATPECEREAAWKHCYVMFVLA